MGDVYERKIQELLDVVDRKTAFKLYTVILELNDIRTVADKTAIFFKHTEKVCLAYINGAM